MAEESKGGEEEGISHPTEVADRGSRDNNRIDNGKNPLAFKTLRSSEPDLCVILKYTDQDGGSQEKSYQMYGANLAKLSNFVDACLSANMKEKETNAVVLEDVTPDIFEKALVYLDSPLAIRGMTPHNVMEVAKFYDKYDFAGGMELCDQVLADYFQSRIDAEFDKTTGTLDVPDNLDLLVDALVVAYNFQLPKSRAAGILYINTRLNECYQTYGPTVFSVEHIRKLHPLFKTGCLDHYIADLTDEELESAAFPRLFVEDASHYFTAMYGLTRTYCLLGTTSTAGGSFYFGKKVSATGSDCYFGGQPASNTGPAQNRIGMIVGNQIQFAITKGNAQTSGSSNWAIFGYDGAGTTTILWESPYSGNLLVPPREPWIPIHEEFTNGERPVLCQSDNI